MSRTTIPAILMVALSSAVALAASAGEAPSVPKRPVHTYSIVARDLATG